MNGVETRKIKTNHPILYTDASLIVDVERTEAPELLSKS
tara:strand:+ start:108 stop:224 length:117 start_codon:yes stop_codon:yes gene_type:complete